MLDPPDKHYHARYSMPSKLSAITLTLQEDLIYDAHRRAGM